MERDITGFRRDEAGDWVAELACRHAQHVRHRPPFRNAPWVLDDAQRAGRVGSPLDCPLCDRAELPAGLVPLRRTAVWDATTVPAALTRSHRVAAGVWGVLHVETGEVRFVAATDPPLDVLVRPGRPQPIPPEVAHHVELSAGARFAVEFHGVPPK